ncbi:hypothetical protein GXP67_19535 [Rhodocytophaga rosea]|uniref:Uncharacterized protein n=1 Tax=Rhodocytophaga rosea TaxID=2704465 RepID=A0A6C0GL26_9BACT|nr:hypothetical protein [Rhodocytophaga rosea]QHT68679.1 hypothetical protein GXP67_19535 [Rhodocytophaga rosea]
MKKTDLVKWLNDVENEIITNYTTEGELDKSHLNKIEKIKILNELRNIKEAVLYKRYRSLFTWLVVIISVIVVLSLLTAKQETAYIKGVFEVNSIHFKPNKDYILDNIDGIGNNLIFSGVTKLEFQNKVFNSPINDITFEVNSDSINFYGIVIKQNSKISLAKDNKQIILFIHKGNMEGNAFFPNSAIHANLSDTDNNESINLESDEHIEFSWLVTDSSYNDSYLDIYKKSSNKEWKFEDLSVQDFNFINTIDGEHPESSVNSGKINFSQYPFDYTFLNGDSLKLSPVNVKQFEIKATAEKIVVNFEGEFSEIKKYVGIEAVDLMPSRLDFFFHDKTVFFNYTAIAFLIGLALKIFDVFIIKS